MVAVPFEASMISTHGDRRAWDATAAELVATMVERWGLRVESAVVGGESASVFLVQADDGQPAVLKVGFPHEEGIWEAVALEAWGPSLAPRVLRQDAWTWSVLLERVAPGTKLGAANLSVVEGIEVGVALLRELGEVAVPDGIPSITDVVAPQLERARAELDQPMAGRPSITGAHRELVHRGLDLLEHLLDSQNERLFVHGDFNPGNILLATEVDSFKVIDPKPMVGDPAFDLWPLVSQLHAPGGHLPTAELHRRMRLAAASLGCDADRAIDWAVARSALSVTWALNDHGADTVAASIRHLASWRPIV